MYLGIDFGTTFSKIATIYLANPLLLLAPGEYGIPSVFYYDQENGTLIGQDALDAGQGTAAANLINEVKMKLTQQFKADGKSFQSKEIVAEIYKTLITKAKQIARTRSIPEKIEGVVISVPAKFGMQERNLIYSAAKECIPGEVLPITDIIKEPVAAALAYFNTNLENNKHVLVYDLGGGTCDVALVKANDSLLERYEVIASDMVRLGGRNWDEVLVNYIAENVEHKNNMAVRGNPAYEEKIRRAAVSVKHQLSDPFKERAIARVEINGRITAVPVTRKVFDEITEHLLKRTLSCLQNVYDQYHVSCKIDEIICVGGSSNMLQVENGIKKMFPQCNVRIYEPEHAVVNGTAIYAEMLKGKVAEGVVLREKTNFSYGIECFDNYDKEPTHLVISNILKKGAVLPTESEKSFYPIKDNMQRVLFPIYESEYAEDNFERSGSSVRHVGDVIFSLPPGTPKTAEIVCKIQLNSQGLLEVNAKGPKGKTVQAEFHIEKM